MNKHSQPGAWSEVTKVPVHIAVIMDGNGRWAAQRGLPRSMGHRAGVEAVRRTVRAAIELKVKYLTLYSFSSENWARPKSEVDDLMGLIAVHPRGGVAPPRHRPVRSEHHLGAVARLERAQKTPPGPVVVGRGIVGRVSGHGGSPFVGRGPWPMGPGQVVYRHASSRLPTPGPPAAIAQVAWADLSLGAKRAGYRAGRSARSRSTVTIV